MATATHPGQTRISWDIFEVAKTSKGKVFLQDHLDEIISGAAFRGSHRSAQFLEYIVQKSAEGNAEALKERTIGMELFGRLPSYNTGGDAVVRVTASDVRKRLAQHYNTHDFCEFQLSLPPGRYVPELVRNNLPDIDLLPPQSIPEPEYSETPLTEEILAVDPVATDLRARQWRQWRQSFLPAIGVLALTVGIILSWTNTRPHPLFSARPEDIPWGTIFDGSRGVLLVASDPNIEEIQRISHVTVSLSNYANQRYIPDDVSHLSATQVEVMNKILRGNKIADFDGDIIAGLQSLIPPGRPRLSVKSARAVRIQDLQTHNNLIFLGSPRSNPWSSMYDTLLDFRFVFDDHTQQESIVNMRPANGEKREYVPTAGGYDTGQSFATISVFQNPGESGRVLIIAGANGEGTQAGGDLVASPVQWQKALESCQLTRNSSKQALQLLLQLDTMAGSANDVKIVACHLLHS